MTEKLEKKLSLLTVVCIATGAMMSSGLFILPGLAFAHAGPAVVLSYLIAGLACIPTILSMSELTSAMPKAGGDYFYITRGFGSLVGTIAGFASWFALSFKSSFALIGMGAYLALLTTFPIQWIAVGICLFFVFLNIVGVKAAGSFQVGLVIGLVIILSVYIIWGGMYVDTAKLTPFFSEGYLAVFSTAGFVFVAYGGLTKIVAMAEEIKKPEKNLVMGMILSLSITALLYFLVVLVTVGVVDPETLKGTLMPISSGADAFGGDAFAKIISIGAFLAFISTGNAGIMSASRYLFGMSRDGHLPAFFQKVSPRFDTPYIALMTTGFFMIFAILALKLEILVKIGSALFLLLYIFANLTVILFRQSRIPSYRPTFRSPFYPYMHLAGIVIAGVLLLEVETGILFLTLVLLLLGALLYRQTIRKRIVRDSALNQILKRLASSEEELTEEDVSTELRNIVISRDNLEEDRYYMNLKKEIWEKIINSSNILDIEEPVKIESLFRRIANLLSGELSLDKLFLQKKFLEREKTSSTIVAKGVAMPHLVVAKKKISKVVLVRAKAGIIFPDDKIVHTVIVVVTSSDQKALHLQIIGNFLKMAEASFFSAEGIQGLKEKELKEEMLAFMEGKSKKE